MLEGAGFRTPTRIHTHGFLTVDGTKMSKSRGTFINASTYREHLDPEYLRYYFAAKLGPNTDDIDLSLDDFVARVNADLVGKVVNIAPAARAFCTSSMVAASGRRSPMKPSGLKHKQPLDRSGRRQRRIR